MDIKTSTLLCLMVCIFLTKASARPDTSADYDDAEIVWATEMFVDSSTNATARSELQDRCTDQLGCPQRCCWDNHARGWYCCGRNAGCCPQQTSNGCCR